MWPSSLGSTYSSFSVDFRRIQTTSSHSDDSPSFGNTSFQSVQDSGSRSPELAVLCSKDCTASSFACFVCNFSFDVRIDFLCFRQARKHVLHLEARATFSRVFSVFAMSNSILVRLGCSRFSSSQIILLQLADSILPSFVFFI